MFTQSCVLVQVACSAASCQHHSNRNLATFVRRDVAIDSLLHEMFVAGAARVNSSHSPSNCSSTVTPELASCDPRPINSFVSLYHKMCLRRDMVEDGLRTLPI